MKIINRYFAVLFFLLSHMVSLQAQIPLQAEDIKAIIQLLQNDNYSNFNSFLNYIHKNSKNLELQETIKDFQNGDNLTEIDYINIYRLMGIFVRCQYKDEMLFLLKELVAIHTDSLAGISQHENPNIIKFGEIIKRTANEFGLAFKNVDNRVFEVTLKGQANTNRSFGIYTHCDVVPADRKKWILRDGTQLDPYKMQIIGDKIYGRGTEDDKAAIATALFAMRAIRESELSVQRDIRLIIETTEEIGGSGFDYYKERHKLPDINVVLDSEYPVVAAEKGFAEILTDFTVRDASGSGISGITVVNMTGGTAINQIPASSIATLSTQNPTFIKARLDKLAEEFVKNNGGNFQIESTIKDVNTIELTVFGISAHSSEPETGVNPVPRAFVFLYTLMQQIEFNKNHFTDAMQYVFDNYGLGFYGKKMGVDYSDEFMGPFTMSVTTVNLLESKLNIGVNGRLPKGKNVQDLKREIEEKLALYKNATSFDFGYEVKVDNYMYRNPEGEWIDILLNIYGDITGNEAKPVSSSGGTTAKQIPNAVSFGPQMPGVKSQGHNANEYKRISNLLLDTQMYTEMILRIGNVDEMNH